MEKAPSFLNAETKMGREQFTGIESMKFYLARDGVAFGPYTEFQVRESIRLGIFGITDLALAENGKEWLEIGKLLPAVSALTTGHSAEVPDRPSAEENRRVLEDPALLLVGGPPSPNRRRRRFALVTVAFVCLVLGILTLGAALRHREWIARSAAESSASGLQPSRVSPSPKPLTPSPPPVMPAAPVSTPLPALAPNTPTPSATVPPAPTPLPASLNDPSAASSPPVSDPSVERSPPAADPSAPGLPAGSPPAGEPSVGSPASASPLPSRKIDGSVAITVKGRLYHPGDVLIRLYSLADLQSYLHRRGEESSREFEDLKGQIADAEVNKERLRKAADATFNAYLKAADSSAAKATLEQENTQARQAREQAANAYYNLLQKREDLLSGAYYIQALPQAAQTSQTDAEGRFVFNVPGTGEFAIAAGIQTKGAAPAKQFYWFLPVKFEHGTATSVRLSDDNVSATASADSLVLTVD